MQPWFHAMTHTSDIEHIQNTMTVMLN